MTRRRILAAGAVAAAVTAGGLALALGPSSPTSVATPRPAAVTGGPLAPCPTEDSPGPCWWDAAARGNGEGHSFWAAADGAVWPLDGAPRAFRDVGGHSGCWIYVSDTSLVACADGWTEES